MNTAIAILRLYELKERTVEDLEFMERCYQSHTPFLIFLAQLLVLAILAVFSHGLYFFSLEFYKRNGGVECVVSTNYVSW